MASAPIGCNETGIERTLSTKSTAILVPFCTQELFMPAPAIYYGLNALSNNMIMADRKRLRTPNGVILGTPGSGKSFSAKREILSCFLITKDDIIICDPEGEYFALVAALHGQVVKLATNSKDYLNPMDIQLIKTGYSNVNDYSKYLQGKYHYMNIGLTSMQGIPTTVSVSSAFLQKCMNDPEKAKYLEENLAAIPDCTKDTINGCLGTVTNQSYMIDANGNIIETASGTNDPDGKIAKENAERKAKENREKEEKVKEKRAAKKAEEEKAAKKRAEKSAEGKETGDYTLSVTGNDVKSMTQSLVAESVSISAPDRSSFDIKA